MLKSSSGTHSFIIMLRSHLLLHVAVIHVFWLHCNVPLCHRVTLSQFIIRSSVSEHLGCVQVCAIMYSTTINIIIHVSWLYLVLFQEMELLSCRLCECSTSKIVLPVFLGGCTKQTCYSSVRWVVHSQCPYFSLVKVLCSSSLNLLLHFHTSFHCLCNFYVFVYLSNQLKHPYIIISFRLCNLLQLLRC